MRKHKHFAYFQKTVTVSYFCKLLILERCIHKLVVHFSVSINMQNLKALCYYVAQFNENTSTGWVTCVFLPCHVVYCASSIYMYIAAHRGKLVLKLSSF